MGERLAIGEEADFGIKMTRERASPPPPAPCLQSDRGMSGLEMVPAALSSSSSVYNTSLASSAWRKTRKSFAPLGELNPKRSGQRPALKSHLRRAHLLGEDLDIISCIIKKDLLSGFFQVSRQVFP